MFSKSNAGKDPLLDAPLWDNWFWMLLYAVLCPLVLLGLYRLVPQLYSDIASHNWPQTQMTVMKIDREKGDKSSAVVYMDFKFTVDGQDFEEKRHLSQQTASLLLDDMEPFLKEYAVGTQHPVFYNPRSPGTEPQIERGGHLVMHVFGFFLCLILAISSPFMVRAYWQVISIQQSGGKVKKKKRKVPRVS